ncbi:MAG: exonuclease subunit SbcD [Syntrophomonadaceae bacterium]|nr:exonuclease subunit SbcD [Syntrophomonadaceae bacterium]
MKILHTSDWHLGKTLEGFSRLDEQERFLDELVTIAEQREIDLIIVAGDIYDSSNPPAAAEQLFYNTLKRLTNGSRAILVIAGNHDSPERLTAANSLAADHGIIIMGKPKSQALTGKFGKLEITETGAGYIKLSINGEQAVILTMPYPSEKRLNEVLSLDDEEKARQESYSERIGELWAKLSCHFSADTINLAVAHIYVVGGEESDSERQIQMGGSLAVDPAVLPDAQYIALGHLHRPQKVKGTDKKAFYSGSPLQYSKSEINYSKCIFMIDVAAGEEACIEEIYLHNYKPVEVWKYSSIEDAFEKCSEERQGERWVYLDIQTDRVLTREEIRGLREQCPDIVQIHPIFANDDQQVEHEVQDYKSIKIDELFRAFFKNRKGAEAPDEILQLFYKIAAEEGGIDETNSTKD